jgi:hypothetical protein
MNFQSNLGQLANPGPALWRLGSTPGEASEAGGALVVYKSRLPAREAAFFETCRGLGFEVARGDTVIPSCR